MEPGTVNVHYWASARAAAGVAADAVRVDGSVTLAELRERAVALHPGTNLAAVLGVCSVLVGEQPVGVAGPRRRRGPRRRHCGVPAALRRRVIR